MLSWWRFFPPLSATTTIGDDGDGDKDNGTSLPYPYSILTPSLAKTNTDTNTNSLNVNDGSQLLSQLALPSPCVLLKGPAKSGKTTLLFQYALSVAQEGKSVLFIHPSRAQLLENPPLLPLPFGSASHMKQNEESEKTTDPPFLKNIHFRYVEDSETLLKLFCGIALLPFLPSLIILDDFHHYFSDQPNSNRLHVLTKTIAVMRDSLRWLNSALLAANDENLNPEERYQVIFLSSELVVPPSFTPTSKSTTISPSKASPTKAAMLRMIDSLFPIILNTVRHHSTDYQIDCHLEVESLSSKEKDPLDLKFFYCLARSLGITLKNIQWNREALLMLCHSTSHFA